MMAKGARRVAWGVGVLGTLAIVLWLALPRGLELVGPWYLQKAYGLSPVSYRVTDISPQRLTVNDVSIGPGGTILRAGSVSLELDVGAMQLQRLLIQGMVVDMVLRDGRLVVPDLADRAAPAPTERAADRFSLPMDQVEVQAARFDVHTPHGTVEMVVDGTLRRTTDGMAVRGSLSATTGGLAAEAGFDMALATDRPLPWGLTGTLHLDLIAEDAALPGLAEGITGGGRIMARADADRMIVVSTEHLSLTVNQPGPRLLDHVPDVLRAGARAGLSASLRGTNGGFAVASLQPHDEGVIVSANGAVDARFGAIAGFIGGDGALTLSRDGAILDLELPQVRGQVDAMPALGGTIAASIDLRDFSGIPMDGTMSAGVSVIGHDLRVDGAQVPRLRLDAAGPLQWDGFSLRMGLADGRLAVDGPTILGAATLPQGGVWTLTQAGEADAIALGFGPGGTTLQTRLAVADAGVSMIVGGQPVQARFAMAEVDALLPLPPGPARRTTATLSDGTLNIGGMEATAVYATVTDDGASGLRLEADARLPRLPGESLPLPDATTERRPLRLRMEAAVPPPGDTATFAAVLRERGMQTLLRAEGSHSLVSGRGQADFIVPRLTFAADGRQPAALYAPLAAGEVELMGDLAAEGRLAWTPAGLAPPTASVLLDSLTLRRGFVVLRDVNGVIRLTDLWPPRTPPGQTVAVGLIEAGLPFQNGELIFHLDGTGNAVIEEAQLSLAGGTISASDVALPLDGSGTSTRLVMQGLRLRDLVALVDLQGLDATGRLSGTLPVELRDGNVLFNEGTLSAEGPGVIRYRPDEAPAALGAGGGGVDLMLQALTDFRYDALRLGIDGSAAGDLTVRLHLAGKNPDLHDGYPLEFNLSLSGALAQVIEGSLTGYQVPDRIQRAMDQFGGGS